MSRQSKVALLNSISDLNQIKNQKINDCAFTNNPATLQTLSNKFQLQLRQDFQTTLQMKQDYKMALKKS